MAEAAPAVWFKVTSATASFLVMYTQVTFIITTMHLLRTNPHQ